MSEVIKKAVEKAVENGYAPTDCGDPVDYVEVCANGVWFYEEDGTGAYRPWSEIVFDPAFGKAFFGEVEGCSLCHTTKEAHGCWDTWKPAWQYHFQQMVILSPEERIEYLKRFI